jgi:hypothetical protein
LVPRTSTVGWPERLSWPSRHAVSSTDESKVLLAGVEGTVITASVDNLARTRGAFPLCNDCANGDTVLDKVAATAERF